MRQFLTRPWGKVAVAMLATVAAVAVGQGLPSEARADHYQFNVTVEKSPSEGGTVTGDGIDCGTDCTGTFAHAVVCDELGCWDTYSGILSATPAPGYAVDGWTGCQGGSSGVWCFVMGDGSDQTVTARFRKAECSDASDNDSDGKVDHPADPDCESPSDDSEAYTPPPDTTPPPLTVTPESIGLTNDPTPTFEFTSTEESVTFTCLVIDMSDAPVKNNYWVDNCTSPYTTPVLKDGPWRIVVWAEDAAGNESPFERRDLTVDTTAPDTSITSGPSGTPPSHSTSFEFSSSESGTTFECSLDGAPFTACTSPKDFSALSQGGHTLEVAATDAAGNRDATPATWSWNVDSVAPDTTIDAGPSGLTRGTAPQFTFSASNAGSTFACKLDTPGGEGSYAACSSPQAYTTTVNGPYTFSVRASHSGSTDPTPASRTFTVDTSAPDTTITGGPAGATKATTASVSFTAPAGSTFECKLDTPAGPGSYAACTSPRSYTTTVKGAYKFSVRATDPAGNIDPTPATRSFTVVKR
jgi:uncharacterized repeat protein (TIGR02543 family)